MSSIPLPLQNAATVKGVVRAGIDGENWHAFGSRLVQANEDGGKQPMSMKRAIFVILVIAAALAASFSSVCFASVDAGRPEVANRRACGIVDGDGGTLFFQAPNGSNGPLYSMHAMNKETAETKELAVGCCGMVNVMEDAVFCIGEVDQGIFRYDRQTGRVTKEYDGIV
jgi:hypothetical protein